MVYLPEVKGVARSYMMLLSRTRSTIGNGCPGGVDDPQVNGLVVGKRQWIFFQNEVDPDFVHPFRFHVYDIAYTLTLLARNAAAIVTLDSSSVFLLITPVSESLTACLLVRSSVFS
jgi:hypothetical protein